MIELYPKRQQYWNTFDDIALLSNMYRRSGESNKELASRYLLSHQYPGAATETGIKNALYTAFYMEPLNDITTSYAILKFRPLSQSEAERYNTVWVFEVYDVDTGLLISDYELIKDQYGNTTHIVIFTAPINTKVRIRYIYLDSSIVKTHEEVFYIKTIKEGINYIETFRLYNENDAYYAGIIDTYGRLTKLGKLIISELEGTMKNRWGEFYWDWDPWGLVGMLIKENTIIKPHFDVCMEAFYEYNQIR
ncbi:MAG: hypothetical protein ACTSWR_08270 [Candidatus Helarchaeota archaeon]